MVKLWCGVYDEGTVFSVNIALNADVESLQKAIASTYKAMSNRVEVYPATLNLYLARKEGETTWLKHDHSVKNFLKGGISTEHKEMLPSWTLDDEEYFGSRFTPGEEEIHVLVDLLRLTLPALPRFPELVLGNLHIPTMQNMVLNPRELVAFWNAFRNDDTDVKADALIELPPDTFLLGDLTLGSRIYIRHCYANLWKICQQKIHDKVTNTPHLVILGNPGIGKTFFGFVILLLLARAGETVVYESGDSTKRYLFSPDVVVQGSRDDFIPILKRPTTYYIVDAVKPVYVPAKTILVTSPRHSIWYQFNKTNCRSCFMPVWSLEEILQCRELMYSDIPVAVVRKCFRRWGGIARFVLRYATLKERQLLLEEAMDQVDLDWLMNACGQLNAKEDHVAHHLLHFRVNHLTFDREYFVFASKYVQKTVYQRLYGKNKQKLLEFIATSTGVGALDVLRGHLFEEHVHFVLPRGGTFRVRKLVNESRTAVTSDAIEQVVLPEQPTVVFNEDVKELKNADTNCYLRPAITNDESVDAIIKPDMLFQVTRADKHSCSQKGLFDALNLMGHPEAPRLFFVLPPDKFTDFKYQKYRSLKRKKEMEPSTDVNVRKIQQFAMEIKLTLE